MKTYSRDEVLASSLEYFNNDDLAAEAFFKYALKDKSGVFYEKNPKQMHKRLSKEFARIESKFGGNKALSEKEIFGFLDHFKYIVPQGSPMMGVGNDFQNVSLSNCVVVDSPEDNMSSIMNTARDLANLFKRRCGVGLDISKLRPEGAGVNNSAGTSTGAWSFSDLYSYVTRMVGQNNRRGALMISIDVRHPDIKKFAAMKRDLSKVTGANISVKLTDTFMKAVRDNKQYEQCWPIDAEEPKFSTMVDAKAVWDIIIESATGFAEPGLLMWDNILKYLPAHCYPEFFTICVNPCGEICLSAFDSCRLISQNLKWYVQDPFTDKAEFDFELLQKHTWAAMRLSDDLVELELEKLSNLIAIAGSDDERILYQKLRTACERGRRTGLGTHGLADAIARMGLRYDSDEALWLVENIYAVRKEAAYQESVDLAKGRGAFPAYDAKLEVDHPFLAGLTEETKASMEQHGRRNISLLTNAPTGTVSIVSQTSSGLEPVFKNQYIRRKKINHDDGLRVDFVDDLGDKWQEFSVSHHNANEWFEINSDGKTSPPLPDYFVESDSIDWERRIEIQAVIQKHVDHSISSTINLPKGTSTEVVGNLYMKAWEKGLKGVTVYVDGSRSGVLVNEEDQQIEFKHVSAPRRPTEMDCDIHQVSVKGKKWVFFVGLMGGKPYEVFGGLSENIEMPPEYKQGKIIKTSDFKTAPNRYALRVNGFTIRNFLKQFDNPTNQVLTRMVSLGLRHGARPSFLVEQLLKDPDNDLTSFSKVLSRVLKRYIIDGEQVTSDKSCTECGSEGLIYQEGCVTCTSCGYAKCG